jgi:hypothetical protein
MPSKKTFYPQVPHAPGKKVAGTNPVGGVAHPGGRALKMVPGHTAKKPPGRTTGLGEPHGWGHAPHQHQGALRVSGQIGAHQVGWPTPHVLKPPPARAPVKAGPIGKRKLPKLPKLP